MAASVATVMHPPAAAPLMSPVDVTWRSRRGQRDRLLASFEDKGIASDGKSSIFVYFAY